MRTWYAKLLDIVRPCVCMSPLRQRVWHRSADCPVGPDWFW